MRCRRRSTWTSASSLSRSWRAIRRSTASPATRKVAAGRRSTRKARPAAGRKCGARPAPPRPRAPPAAAPAPGTGTRRSSSRRSSSRPRPVALDVTQDRDVARPARSRQAATRAPRPPPRGRGRPWRARGCAAARPSRRVGGQLALDRSRGCSTGSEPSSGARSSDVHQQARALDVGQEVVAEAGARRWRPRSARGCRRGRAGARPPSSVPSTGSSVVNG